jgi:hypothetical protein
LGILIGKSRIGRKRRRRREDGNIGNDCLEYWEDLKIEEEERKNRR